MHHPHILKKNDIEKTDLSCRMSGVILRLMNMFSDSSLTNKPGYLIVMNAMFFTLVITTTRIFDAYARHEHQRVVCVKSKLNDNNRDNIVFSSIILQSER
jgi:hypothetical protein